MKQRICIFCTNPANSKEDLWPIWVLNRVNPREKIRRTIGQNEPYLTDSRKIRIKSVCRQCNNNWMSQLETECIPLIGFLIQDGQCNLDTAQQALVSTWASKIAMVLDSTDKNPKQFYLKDECTRLKDLKTIPPNTSIWLGRYFGRSLHAGGSTFTALDKGAIVGDCSRTAISRRPPDLGSFVRTSHSPIP
jgi:hypothetical protein